MHYKVLLVFSVVVSVLWTSCKSKKETTTAEIKNITESVYSSGYIKSKNQYEVFGKPNNIVKEIFVTEGTPVQKGSPIFQMENNTQQLSTENARLASIAADFRINNSKLRDGKKAVDLAQKKLVNDSMQYERQQKLWDKNIGTKLELERKELAYQNSKVDLARARTNYDDLKRQLKLASDQSKNNLEIAKLLEDDYIVKSEIDGVVYRINKESGEVINTQEPVVIIGTEEFIIELSIDELDIVKVKKGQQVVIRMDSYKAEVFEAKIIAIDPMMNKRTRSFQAEAIFITKPKELFPNLTVEASIVVNTKDSALTIPRQYLINDSAVLLKGGELRKVETGLMDYDLVEILNGIDQTTSIELPQK